MKTNEATINVKASIPEGKSGDWEVKKFTIPKYGVEVLRCALHGRPVYPGEYTKLTERGRAIMSDTPAELNDLLPLVNAVNRMQPERVLINGLGLGVAILCILPCPSIKTIDVVELEKDVIDLVAPHLKHDDKIRIHRADAYTKKWGRGEKWDLVWHDIWPNIPDSDDLKDIARLKRKYAKRCKWQGVWAEKEHKRIPKFHRQAMRRFYKITGIDKAMRELRKQMKDPDEQKKAMSWGVVFEKAGKDANAKT